MVRLVPWIGAWYVCTAIQCRRFGDSCSHRALEQVEPAPLLGRIRSGQAVLPGQVVQDGAALSQLHIPVHVVRQVRELQAVRVLRLLILPLLFVVSLRTREEKQTVQSERPTVRSAARDCIAPSGEND